mmetsp:Transcript_29500/g.60307  ORF Transcript_29500/g.60307 Transcript_29500/m.60307 type:complete len:101 (+) Transcript_29500:87-389(+)
MVDAASAVKYSPVSLLDKNEHYGADCNPLFDERDHQTLHRDWVTRVQRNNAMEKKKKVFSCFLTIFLAVIFGLAIFHWARYVDKWNSTRDELPAEEDGST